MRTLVTEIRLLSALLLSLLLLPSRGLDAQVGNRLFPPRALMPDLLAGPRNPLTSAALFGVTRNPDQHGRGVEAEVSIGSTLPVLLLAGTPQDHPVVVGLEAAAYARFALQVLEREMVATDWFFTVPVILHHDHGWTRIRYFHTSSHMGDEYNRRFGDPGVNVSRDAVGVLTFRRLGDGVGGWAGARYGYNVHPDDDRRWVLRAGAQAEGAERGPGRLRPFLAADVEMDQEGGMRPRTEVRAGIWLPEVAGRPAVRLSLVALHGPTPLGQFRFRSTTQIGLSLQGSL